MPESKIPEFKSLSPKAARYKRAMHVLVLKKALPKVEKLKRKIIRKKGKIKPEIGR